jgi:NADPH:quinone reductase-like Zn-dependent oxidoreductase
MRAIEIQHGKLVETTRPIPEPAAGQVRIRVHAFGVNRAETYMRRGLWGDTAKVTGIECAGEVDAGPIARGTKVWALMGGLGRSLNGSYAEYTCAPLTNVVPIPETRLSWPQLAALPESFATAWMCLHGLTPGETLLVRGGTSALGQAAIQLALRHGARVFASTRTPDKHALLRKLGAEPNYDGVSFDAVLDLIGSSTLVDSMKRTRRGGRVCVAGFLGGHEPLALDPVLMLPSGRQLSVFASFLLGSSEFPLSEIPFGDFLADVERGLLHAAPAHVFALSEVARAHALMEADQANGKLVVSVSGA